MSMNVDIEEKTLKDECIVLDIETTGFSARNDAILRIDAVKVKDGEIIDSFSEYIHQEKELLESIAELTGITEECVKYGKPEHQVVANLISFMRDGLLIVFYTDFDMAFLKVAYKQCGLHLDTDFIDLYKVCKYIHPSKSINKSFLIEKYEIDDSTDNDCMIYAKVYNKVCKELKQRNITTFEELNRAIFL